MIVKRITFFGKPATHACDGKCGKAWGVNSRPRAAVSENPDDFAYVADRELGTAPVDPGTYEGGHAKPVNATGPEHINKWCVRECERSWLSPIGNPDAVPELPDFSVRHYNIAPHRRSPTLATVPPRAITRDDDDEDAALEVVREAREAARWGDD